MSLHYRDEMRLDTLMDKGTVDGEFSSDNLNASDKAELEELQGLWFDEFDSDQRRAEGAGFVGQAETVFDGAW